MSKYPSNRMILNGVKPVRYDTGEVKHTYLRRWHHMPERWKNGRIRRIMWIATQYKLEEAFNRQQNKL